MIPALTLVTLMVSPIMFAAPIDAATTAAPVERTVFVTITDGKGAPVPDLTPADFVVKEGGKEREITKAERSTAKMRLALAVEERMMGDTAVRMGIFEFAKRLGNAAEVSLITMGLRNTTIVDYTTDLNVLVDVLNKYTLNPSKDSALAEGILDVSNRFTSEKPARPVIVVVALSGGQIAVEARLVLDKLRDSGAQMFAATLAGASAAPSLGTMNDHAGREQVLGDGSRQSGGRRIDVNATSALPNALQQFANDLLSQYAITYTLPDGVKPNRRFEISTKRRGLSMRAPSAISDR
jgi:VWFA-related protein